MSNRPETSVKGAAFAEFFSRGSRLVSRPRWLQRFVVGDNDIPEGWTHIPQLADTITAVTPWIHFDGDPKGPRLPMPRLYHMAGLLAVAGSEIDDLQANRRHSRQAVAIRFEDAVVVGALTEGQSYRKSRQDETLLLTTTLIGRGDVDAAIGVYLPDRQEFLPVITAHGLGRMSVEAARQQLAA